MRAGLIILGVALLPWLYKEEIKEAGVNQAIWGYAGVHGQTSKYCPASIEPCYEGVEGLYTVKRINERWIRVYSLAF